MRQRNADSPGENTNVIVNSMRKQRRSMRVPIVLGIAGVGLLVLVMALGLGSQRQANYQLDNTKPGAAPREMLSADGHSAESAAEVGSVEVHLQGGGQLWIDEKNHGSASVHMVKLDIGPHTLCVKHKGAKSVSQRVTVTSDKTVLIAFRKNKVAVSERLNAATP